MQQNIVILGAGFGGLKCALRLWELLRVNRLQRKFQIILIDRSNFQTFVPMFYEVANTLREEASAIKLKELIAIPIEQALADTNIKFLQNEVTNINPAIDKIILKDAEEIDFEYLVVALGSETNTFGIPGIKEHAYFLKTLEDAIQVRNVLEKTFQSNDKKVFRVLIGGGGLTGVELAGELGSALCKLKRKYKHEEQKCEIILVEGNQEILPGFSQKIVKRARRRLDRLDVKILTSRLISSFDGKRVLFLQNESVEVDMLIWTGGVQVCSMLKITGLPVMKKGDLETESNLKIKRQDKIFAIGDAACFVHKETGKPLPWNVPVAEQEALIVSQNILRSIKKLPLLEYHPPKHVPMVIPIGGKYAIADLGFVRFYGLVGWIIKHLVTLRYYLSILPWWVAVSKWLRAMRVFIRND